MSDADSDLEVRELCPECGSVVAVYARLGYPEEPAPTTCGWCGAPLPRPRAIWAIIAFIGVCAVILAGGIGVGLLRRSMER